MSPCGGCAPEPAGVRRINVTPTAGIGIQAPPGPKLPLLPAFPGGWFAPGSSPSPR